MLWNGKKVNITNYNEVFKGYPVDVKEVIRSAILDDTDIVKYISKKANPYLLWQIKLAIDEGLDSSWFKIARNGDTLYKIRKMNRRGINLEPLAKELSNESVTDLHIKYILDWYEKGLVLEKYDFSILPSNLLEVFDYGIGLGYPMNQFNNGVQFRESYVYNCIKLLSNRKAVVRFLDGDWEDENLDLLVKYSSTKFYDKIIDYITKDITPSVLEEIYECCRVGIPVKDVAVVDEDGIYIYSKHHLVLIREAFLNNFDYRKLLNMSLKSATSVYSEMEMNASRKLSGRLRKTNS